MSMPAGERLGFDIKRVEQELMAAKNEAVRTARLTVPQYAALFALSDSPGISSAALGRACMVTPQAMTVVIRNLEERGLVRRTRHRWHRNVLETHLTDAGRAALRAADERAVAIERRIFEEFTPEERETLRALLARCSKAIKARGGSAAAPW
ncbi:MarR family winged helix-turn-helix transcriptional regulator [Sphaerisporangium album]|nr:MarR family transcriptional regulator [Sphaerisporangium album]